LTKADERLDDSGRTKLLGLLAAGDPKGEVKTTWHAKEVIRSIYEIDDPELADEFVTRLANRPPRSHIPLRGTFPRPDSETAVFRWIRVVVELLWPVRRYCSMTIVPTSHWEVIHQQSSGTLTTARFG
jgi:hypothetical protein